MRNGEIHIGDVLRIRQWSDMAVEYGTTDLDEDYYYCMIQVSPLESDKVKVYFSEEGVEETDFTINNCYPWYICAEMLEPQIE